MRSKLIKNIARLKGTIQVVTIDCHSCPTDQVFVTLFYEVWDKNPTPVAEKVIKCHRQ